MQDFPCKMDTINIILSNCLIPCFFQGAAGAVIHYMGYTPGLFIVGLFGILIMWMYGYFWITGMLLIAGGLFYLNI